MQAWRAVPILALLLLAGCKRHNATGTPADIGSATRIDGDRAAAATQQSALLNASATGMDTDVPAEAQRLIPAFKDALVQLADDVLAGQPASANAAQVQQALQAVLPAGKAPDDSAAQAAAKAAGKNEFDTPEKGDYGGEVKAVVSELQPGVLLADVGFGIQCGDDHMLLAYSNTGGHWRRILRWQAPPYKEVSGAFGDMFIPLKLNTQRNGHTVLLVVHGTPWCTSTMSGFSMDTFEVDPSSMIEKPFWNDGHSYRRADDFFRLKPTSDGFEVRTSVTDWGNLDGSVNRIGVMRYALADATFHRTLPIGMNSRESVAEWLSMPRDEARLFTDAREGSSTWAMWQAQTFIGKDDKAAMAMPSISYGDVRACTDPQTYQVEIRTHTDAPGGKGQQVPGPGYYVQVHETGNGYRIGDTAAQPSADCMGKVIALKSSGDAMQASEEQ